MGKEITPAPVPKPMGPIVYPFRIKGTNRVYEVDAAHLPGMRSRLDAEYIGTIPFPTKNNEKPTA